MLIITKINVLNTYFEYTLLSANAIYSKTVVTSLIYFPFI